MGVGARRWAAALAFVVLAVTLLALAGWLAGSRRLSTLYVGNAAMKFNQGVALALLAVSVLAHVRRGRESGLAAGLPAAIALAIAVLTLGEHTRLPIRIDELLFVEPPGGSLGTPGRMSISSSLAIAALAAALLSLRDRRHAWVVASQGSALLALAIGLLRLVSYSYGVSPFATNGTWGMMGVHSAVCFVLLAIAALLLEPSHGLATLFTGQRPGSLLARRLWLPLLAIDLLFGCALEWGDFADRYGYAATMAVLSIVNACVLSVAIGWTARALNESSARLVQQRQMYAVSSGINTAIARIRDRDKLFQEACRLLVEDGGFAFASVGFIATGDEGFFRSATGDLPLRELHPLFSRSPDSALRELPASRVARSGEPLLLPAEQDALAPAGIHEPATRPPGWQALYPLRLEGQVVGVLAVRCTRMSEPDAEMHRMLSELGDDLAFGVEFLQKEARLNFLAYHDALTGLPNATLFLESVTTKLAEPRHSGQHVAVIVLDLDRFSQINDSLGRECGDALLQVTARRLRRVMGRDDMVARLSADSFGLTLVGTAEEIVERVAIRVLESLQEPFVVDRQVRMSGRAGIALAPQDGTDAATLFANAEAALKHAQASRDLYRLYSPSINSSVGRRVSMETRLRNAIDQHEFVLHFQPKFDAATRRVTGVEGLLRWQDPEDGLVAPAHFVPVLEDTGLMVPVGWQIIDLALAARRHWLARGLVAPRIAINVSGVQFRGADLVSEIRAALERAGADGSCLEIEITESVLVKDDGEATLEALRELRAMGITIAVDDFGTGYSSLQYLADLPIDKVKIDRSFVQTMLERPKSAAIVATIVFLAHTLGLTVVAEGVETEAQAFELRALGCDELQGYLLGRPQEEGDVAALLERLPQAAALAS